MDKVTRTDLKAWMEAQIDDAIRITGALRASTPLLDDIARRMTDVMRGKGQVFFFGNGGSAADAQHWAAELSGRFYLDRDSLPAIALMTNASQMTAFANDYGYDQVFARALSGMSHPGDMAVGISTSGRSANVLRALQVARERGLVTIGFTGAHGDEMTPLCDAVVQIPSHDVARIQEGHELCAHLICAAVERALFDG